MKEKEIEELDLENLLNQEDYTGVNVVCQQCRQDCKQFEKVILVNCPKLKKIKEEKKMWCKCCIEEKELAEGSEYCPSCEKSLEENLKTQIFPKSYWDKTGQILFDHSKGYCLDEKLKPFCLGTEQVILKALQDKEIPTNISEEQESEYTRIFQLMEGEKNDHGTRKSDTKRAKIDRISPKLRRGGNKRARPLHTSRRRRPHSRKSTKK